MVGPSPRVAPAGRREEYVNGPRVRLDNLIRRSLKRKKELASVALRAGDGLRARPVSADRTEPSARCLV
jgi:hypothetical protein